MLPRYDDNELSTCVKKIRRKCPAMFLFVIIERKYIQSFLPISNHK